MLSLLTILRSLAILNEYPLSGAGKTKMIKYEFTNVLKAHSFHAQALLTGPASMHLVPGVYPDTWFVWVSPEFDAIVEARKVA